jgi:DNA-binding MarR family transcriptional regulator
VLDLEKRLAAHLAAHGLTTPQFYVLKTLQEQGGSWSIGKIARAHGLTNAAMTGLISRMEAVDPPLVARRTDDRDRRGVLVRLTQAGYSRYEAVQQALLDNLRAIFALLPADERAHLVAPSITSLQFGRLSPGQQPSSELVFRVFESVYQHLPDRIPRRRRDLRATVRSAYMPGR